MKQVKSKKAPVETPWERLNRAFRSVLTVPKEELLKEEAKLKMAKARKKAKKLT